MAGELVRFSAGGHQPAQKGKVTGTSATTGNPLAKSIEWLVDTGSPVCAVSQAIANDFALRPAGTGTRAQGAGGGQNILPRKGLTVEFTIEDPTGAAKTVSLAVVVYVGLVSGAVLGMHELAAAKAVITWDAFNGTGKLTGP